MSADASDSDRFERDLDCLAKIGSLLGVQTRPEEAWRNILLDLLPRLDAAAAAIVIRTPPRQEISLRATAYAPGVAPISWLSYATSLLGPRGLARNPSQNQHSHVGRPSGSETPTGSETGSKNLSQNHHSHVGRPSGTEPPTGSESGSKNLSQNHHSHVGRPSGTEPPTGSESGSRIGGGPQALPGLQIGGSIGDRWLLCAPLPYLPADVGALLVVLADPDTEELPRVDRLLDVVAAMLALDRAGWQRLSPSTVSAAGVSSDLRLARQDAESSGLASAVAPSSSPTEDLKARVARLEKEAIAVALESTAGNVAAAARLLGVTPRIVRYKIKKMGIACAQAADSSSEP